MEKMKVCWLFCL
uniref:Uncharacterized protein n=1 Tax=Anguilla anguilla TaxID=7936 RepID=A0A0E9VAS4_ANGAN